MPLVAGVDSSTQSCKVVVRDDQTGELVRSGRAPHPDGTEVDPAAWWGALERAVTDAGGLEDVSAVGVGAQQHGMVALDEQGRVVRDALLWNDNRSATQAADLIRELGEGDEARGRQAWAERTGIVPVASFTATKVRWLAEHEPANADRVAAFGLPHDWLSWRLLTGDSGDSGADLDLLATDAGDASGTGWFDARSRSYRPELLELAFGRAVRLPRLVGPAGAMGEAVRLAPGAVVSAGSGDNAAAALALGIRPGDVVLSLGTSCVVSAVGDDVVPDPSGTVAGFCDATGRRLPLVCTLNGTRVLAAMSRLLNVDLDEFSRLALSAEPGSGGLVLIPYLEGERTPNRPEASGTLHGIEVDNATSANLARAAVEGLLCGMADGVEALQSGGYAVDRVLLIGGGARSEAVCEIAPSVLGVPVVVPTPGEYVADGAARQAAWALAALRDAHAQPPDWPPVIDSVHDAVPTPQVRGRYAEVRDALAS